MPPARKASWKPFVSAIAGVEPVESSVLVVEVAIADSTAMPECSTDLLRGVDQAGRKPGLSGLDTSERSDRDRHEREADAEPDEQEARQQVAGVTAADGDLREVDEAQRSAAVIPTTSTGLTPIHVTSWAATADQTIAVPATAK